MTETPMIQRVRELVDPIATDLDLDVYDIEQRGATLRVTLDTRPGNPASVDLEQLSLATRLISRELDHDRPGARQVHARGHQPGRRAQPAHSCSLPARDRQDDQRPARQRRSRPAPAGGRAGRRRRQHGHDQRSTSGAEPVDHVIEISAIDRARTVFVWGPQPKPGKPGARKAGAAAKPRAAKQRASAHAGSDEVPRESSPDPEKEPS